MHLVDNLSGLLELVFVEFCGLFVPDSGLFALSFVKFELVCQRYKCIGQRLNFVMFANVEPSLLHEVPHVPMLVVRYRMLLQEV